jgi:hypothetical protein
VVYHATFIIYNIDIVMYNIYINSVAICFSSQPARLSSRTMLARVLINAMYRDLSHSYSDDTSEASEVEQMYIHGGSNDESYSGK